MSKNNHKKIATIILEYNNPKMTLETIRSVKKAKIPTGFQNQIVVVDNSQVPDGSLKKQLKKFNQIKLITNQQNTGFAKGNNIGIEYALKRGCQYFLLLNNDVEVDVNFLDHLLAAAASGADMVVPKIYFAKGYEFHKDRYRSSQLGKVIWYAGGYIDWKNVYSKHIGINEVDKGQYDRLKEIEFANFCCLLINKSVLKKIGFLDEKYFLYWEDADFSLRAKLAGFKQVYQPKSIIWHENSGSSGSGSKLHDYYLTRNRLIFGYKYAPPRVKLALFRESVRKMITGRLGEKKGIIDYYLHRFGKGSFV